MSSLVLPFSARKNGEQDHFNDEYQASKESSASILHNSDHVSGAFAEYVAEADDDEDEHACTKPDYADEF